MKESILIIILFHLHLVDLHNPSTASLVVSMVIREISGREGILPHIDLLKFDDVVLGISLLSEATMIFRRV